MPKLSVWLVRASLIHMGLGFLFGSMILHHKGIPIYPWTWQLLNPHIEIMIFGWTIQFVMGMAFWILPRFHGEGRYGKSAWGWWSLVLLNGGVLLVAMSSWFFVNPLILAGRLCTLVALLLFIRVVWPRVKPLSDYAPTRAAPIALEDTFSS